jgi:hypothetical protein
MSPALTPDQEARQVRKECLVWLDGLGAAASAAHPLEADSRPGNGIEALVALIEGECFFIECLASRQVHHRRSHEHQQTRFRVHRARCLTVRSARELEQLLRAHFATSSTRARQGGPPCPTVT